MYNVFSHVQSVHTRGSKNARIFNLSVSLWDVFDAAKYGVFHDKFKLLCRRAHNSSSCPRKGIKDNKDLLTFQ